MSIKAIEHESPSYPAVLVPLSLPPCDVRVRVIVNRSGHVSAVRDLNNGFDVFNYLFYLSIRNKINSWIYTPLVISEWEQRGDHSVAVDSRVVPFSMDYIFHFEMKNGAPIVVGKNGG